SLASAGSVLQGLSSESYDHALERVQNVDHVETWRNAVRHVRMEDARARHAQTLESRAMQPPPGGGRKIRVARNKGKMQWLLATGPEITRAAMQKRVDAACQDEVMHRLQEARDDIVVEAEELEAKAKALREDAKAVDSDIRNILSELIG